MRVFKIRLDSNKYQSFLPCDEQIWRTDTLRMDCRRKKPNWASPKVYIFNPKIEAGNFYHMCSGAFVADTVAATNTRDLMEMAGELLEIVHNHAIFYLANILECANCLDQEKTEWVSDKKTGALVRIAKYEFIKSRFPESTIFKIPETAGGELLTYSGLKDPEDEFKSRVERLGLKGLVFDEVWSD